MNAPAGTTAPSLAFAVMLPRGRIPWWQAEVIRRVLASGAAKPALVIVDAAPPEPRRRRFRRESSWNLYNRCFVRGRVAAAAPEAWEPLLPGVPVIHAVAERRGAHSEHLNQADLAAIRGRAPDFILRFAFNILRGEVLAAARYGVWSFHHGDLFLRRGQPACFWEVHGDDPVTGVTLQRLTDRLDGGVVLGIRHIPTVRKSYVRTRDLALRAGVDMVTDACRSILRGDSSAVEAPAASTRARLDRVPGPLTVLSFVLRLSRRRVADAIRWLFFHDQWNVGVLRSSVERLLEGRLSEPDWLPAPVRGEFLADPFALRRGEEIIILAEHLRERENLGRIRAVRLSASGAVLGVDEPFSASVHLSYPYLVRDGERYLCVPEMAESGEVALFESDSSGARWRRSGTLLRGVRLLDPCLFSHEGRWWLVGARRDESGLDELHAWHAPSPEGPWSAHLRNPLKVDPRSTRPAGVVFRHKGALYRPAQDCSRTYGGAVCLNRVDVLTPEAFEETGVARLECGAGWRYARGMHTLSRLDDDTFVMDAKRTRFSLHAMLRQIRAKLGRGGPGRSTTPRHDPAPHP